MTFVKTFAKGFKDENVTLLDDSLGAAEFTGYIDTGCYILNALLSGSIYGGVPNNKVTALAGETTTGKTYFALSIVKHFLDSDPAASVIYFDTEAAVTREMMHMRGIDTSRILLAEPDTIQKFRHQALKMLAAYEELSEDKRPPLLMVLDSLGMLSTTKELEDSTEGKDTRDMTKAQVIKATFRTVTLKLGKLRVPLILTNHVYDVIGSYVPMKTMSGGAGLRYAASTIIYLSKKKDKEGKDVVGNIIKAKLEKSRITRENSVVEMKLNYVTGLDKYYGLLDLAEKYGIIKKVSTRYEMPDGTKLFAKTINEEPEKYFTPELLDQIDEVARKEFLYGDQSEE